MQKDTVFIIGLGRFGLSAAKKLLNNNWKVVVIDMSEELINKNMGEGFHKYYILDATDKDALIETDIKSAAHVIVAMSNIEESIMTCAVLGELGIKEISAKAKNNTHKNVLKTLGVKTVVIPEERAGEQVAFQVANKGFNIYRTGFDYVIFSLVVRDEKIIGSSVETLNKAVDYKVIAIKNSKPNSSTIFNLKDYVIQKMDRIYIIGDIKKINAIKADILSNKSK